MAVPDPTSPAFPTQAMGFAPVPCSPLGFRSIVVASSNDPYATFEFAASCAEAWQSRLVSVGALGHVNAASNLGEWELGLELLLDLDASS